MATKRIHFLGRVSRFLLYITMSQTDTGSSIRFLVLAAEADMDIKGVRKVMYHAIRAIDGDRPASDVHFCLEGSSQLLHQGRKWGDVW